MKIKTSEIENAGKGLFAYSKIPNELLFKKDQTVIKYYGELIDNKELIKIYTDEFTAPYAVEISKS